MADETEEQSTSRTIPFGGKLDDRENIDTLRRSFDDLPKEVQDLLISRKNRLSKETRSTIAVLEQKHMLTLILYLDKMSPVLKTDIYNDVSRCSNMTQKLDDLEDLGLISTYYTGRTNSHIMMITEKGRLVADCIREIRSIIESDSSDA